MPTIATTPAPELPDSSKSSTSSTSNTKNDLNISVTNLSNRATTDLEAVITKLQEELAQWRLRVQELDAEAQEYYDEYTRLSQKIPFPLALLVGFILGLLLGLII